MNAITLANVIQNPVMQQPTNVTVSHLQTTPPKINLANAIFSQNSGPTGAYLDSLSLAFGSEFQSNYKYMVVIEGTNQQKNQFQKPSATSATFEYVPSTKRFSIPANKNVMVFGYNWNSSSTDAVLDVYCVMDYK